MSQERIVMYDRDPEIDPKRIMEEIEVAGGRCECRLDGVILIELGTATEEIIAEIHGVTGVHKNRRVYMA